MAKRPTQKSLFDDAPGDDPDRTKPEGDPAAPKKKASRVKVVEPASVSNAELEYAAAIPEEIRLGTSSWAFPGWEGLVYKDRVSDQKLSREGLAAYASHPLFRTVGLDRTHYAPMTTEQFREHAVQVPMDFRFLVKAHEACTIHRWPTHPRYGQRKGELNDRFLDPTYAARHCVEPMIEGLGEKAGPLLFQIAPQSMKEIGGAAGFIEKLHAFLSRLPKGPLYAVEVRNRELLTPEYDSALKDAGVLHCLNSLRRMPPLVEQWQRASAAKPKALLIRWMVHKSQDYESALDRYEPFNALVDEDPPTRDDIAKLAVEAALTKQQVYVIINNKAEGSAPLSIFKLAAEIAREL